MLMRWGGFMMVLLGIGVVLAPAIVTAMPAPTTPLPPVPDPLYCAVLGGFLFVTGWILIACAAAVRRIEHLRSSTRRRLDMIERHTLATSSRAHEIAACGTALVDALARADRARGADRPAPAPAPR